LAANLLQTQTKTWLSQKPAMIFCFAASVAGFGMLLRHRELRQLTYPLLLGSLANNGRGKDTEGYRAEFLRLLESAEMLNKYAPKRPVNG